MERDISLLRTCTINSGGSSSAGLGRPLLVAVTASVSLCLRVVSFCQPARSCDDRTLVGAIRTALAVTRSTKSLSSSASTSSSSSDCDVVEALELRGVAGADRRRDNRSSLGGCAARDGVVGKMLDDPAVGRASINPESFILVASPLSEREDALGDVERER